MNKFYVIIIEIIAVVLTGIYSILECGIFLEAIPRRENELFHPNISVCYCI